MFLLSLQQNYCNNNEMIQIMSKKMMVAALLLAQAATGLWAQQAHRTSRDYLVRTNQAVAADSGTESADSTEVESEARKDFISRNFPYFSMCDWQPGMRFMVIPSQKDLVIKVFANSATGAMVSTNMLKHEIMVYDGHARRGNDLHEHVNFHLERDANMKYYFEVPTSSFDDYCYGKVGVPSLAYLDDVDTAIDSLVGKQVKLLVRQLCQDSETDGSGFREVDLGSDKRGQLMTITKVGVGTRNYPVKIIVSDGVQEYFQNVAISRTNCGLRDDEFEVSDIKMHSFRDVFELLDDKMAVDSELQAYVGKTVYTMLDTQMRDDKGNLRKVKRLSTFEVTNVYALGSANHVTLELKGKVSGSILSKDVLLKKESAAGQTELMSDIFAEGDPSQLPNVHKNRMSLIQQGRVSRGFTEAEVRLALGEPSEIEAVKNGVYRWLYEYTDTVRPFRSVTFGASTHLVRSVTQ